MGKVEVDGNGMQDGDATMNEDIKQKFMAKAIPISTIFCAKTIPLAMFRSKD